MSATQFSLAHYLLATHGIGLIRSWAIDDGQRSGQLIKQMGEICDRLDTPPYSQPLQMLEQTPVAGYSTWAASYDEDNVSNPLVPLEEQVLGTLLRPVESGRALDAACGTGRQIERLRSLGYDVVGVDATPAMLDKARHRHPDIHFLEGDLRDLPVEEAQFDLVLSTLAITHVPELDRVIAEIARVLRSGGQVVLVDVHPVQVMLGAHATASQEDANVVVRNQVHLPSAYLNAFWEAGLQVKRCYEPTFTEELVGYLPAAEHCPEANRMAFVGTPALLVWALYKQSEEVHE